MQGWREDGRAQGDEWDQSARYEFQKEPKKLYTHTHTHTHTHERKEEKTKGNWQMTGRMVRSQVPSAQGQHCVSLGHAHYHSEPAAGESSSLDEVFYL